MKPVFHSRASQSSRSPYRTRRAIEGAIEAERLTIIGQALFAEDSPLSTPLPTYKRRQDEDGEWERQCRYCADYLPEDSFFFLERRGRLGWMCRECSSSRRAQKEARPSIHKGRLPASRRSESFSAEDLEVLWERQQGLCHWCSVPLVKEAQRRDSYVGLSPRGQVDHLVPLSKGGTNTVDNIVLACPACNQKKRDKLPEEFASNQ